MGILNIDNSQIIAFFLVLARMSGLIVSWPLFGGYSVPRPLKALLALTLSLVCFSLISSKTYPEVLHYQSLILLGAKELFIGLGIGYLAHLVFFATTIAGELVSMAMGLSASQILNPAMGSQQSIVSQFYYLLTAFIYLLINGHHFLIEGIFQSFEIIPLHRVTPDFEKLGGFFMMGADVLELGFMLSAPVIIAILVVNFALGVMGRTVPQINVLITSLPINALVGLTLLTVALPFCIENLQMGFYDYSESIFKFMRAF